MICTCPAGEMGAVAGERHATWCDLAYLDENPAYGPGNPDWEHDRDREERSTRAAITDDVARDQAALDRGDAPL